MGSSNVHIPRRLTIAVLASAMLVAAIGACSPTDLVNDAPLPPDVPDPGSTKTPAGALAAYYGTLSLFNSAFGGRGNAGNTSAVAISGLISDELQSGVVGSPVGAAGDQLSVDSRSLPEFTSVQIESQGGTGAQLYEATYAGLQSVRGQASEARGLLMNYAPESQRPLVGHLFAIQGEAEVMLADIFCSGIPLSTIELDGDYTLQPGSTTKDVYQHAIVLFDSALTLAADSERFVNLASVGKGRALLAIGDYAGAATAVAGVPDGFSYLANYPPAGTSGAVTTQNFAVIITGTGPWELSTSDNEGVTGLDFRSSGDPRTTATELGNNQYGVAIFHPDKYALTGDSPIVVADWVEARLIEAEAALEAGDLTTWLAKLNHLRETAISPALPDTTDPGTADARLDLTFRERAFWLYLTAHRQGDLRRLVRQYGRAQNTVFPTGGYRGARGSYGGDVTVPITARERVANPLFTGCIGRGA